MVWRDSDVVFEKLDGTLPNTKGNYQYRSLGSEMCFGTNVIGQGPESGPLSPTVGDHKTGLRPIEDSPTGTIETLIGGTHR